MIELLEVERANNGLPVLNGVSARFRPGDRVGILGAAGSGKSTLIRLIAGAERPDSGRIRIGGRVSWPLGLAAAFHPALSGAENISHLSPVVGLDPDFAVAFATSFAQIDGGLPVRSYTPAMRARLGMAFSLAAPFDCYLADEVTGTGDEAFRALCDAMLAARLKKAGLILVARRAAALGRHCNRFFALVKGRLVPCRDPEEAGALVAAAAHREQQKSETPDA